MLPATDTRWSELHAALRAFIRRRARSESDADDILQEVFAKVLAAQGSLEHEARFHAWLYTIARNATLDHYRARRPIPAGDALPDLPDEAEPDGEERSALAACLLPMIERLPDKYREALRLTELGGLTQEAAAERLGLSLSGAKSRVQRGREQLREMLTDCCRIELDRGGRIADVERTERSCRYCGESEGSACTSGGPGAERPRGR